MPIEFIKSIILILFLGLFIFSTQILFAQDYRVMTANDSAKILPERERARVRNEWLKWRLENVIPEIMRREGIDLWLIINREYVDSAMKKATAEGLRPLIYSHPVGLHGHAAGAQREARPPETAPEGVRIQREYPLYPNTVYAIEFSCTTNIPEWENQEVRIGFEEMAVFTRETCVYIDGHHTKFLLIK